MKLSKMLATQRILHILLTFVLISSSTLLAQNQDVVIFGELVVYSLPESDAEVYIDGKFVGKTPLLKKIEVGKHELTLKKEMYYDYSKTILIYESRSILKAKMNPKYGYVRVETTPIGADVYFNGQKFEANTNCTSRKILAGELGVSIRLNEYQPVDTIITVSEGKVSNIKLNLVKIPLIAGISRQDYENQLYGTETVTKVDDSIVTDFPIQDNENQLYGTETVANVDDSIATDIPIQDNENQLYDAKTVAKVDNPVASVSKQNNKNQHKGTKTVKKVKKVGHSLKYVKKDFGNSFWFKAGIGLSNVWGKDVKSWSSSGYKMMFPSWYIGAQYTMRFNRFIALNVDLDYSETGYVDNNDTEISYIMKFHGIDLPVVARFYFLNEDFGPLVELGGIVNYRSDYKVKTKYQSGYKTETISDCQAFNYGLVAGLGYDFRIGKVVCTANARAVMELSKLFDNANFKLVNFQFGIGIKIF